jgi:hypothetical protein
MPNQLLSIVLASNILACPYLCGGGDLGCIARHDAGPRDCCHDGPAAPGDTDHSGPREQHQHPAGTCCQCICAGAVVNDSGSHDLHLCLSHWSSLLSVEPFLAAGLPGQLTDEFVNPPYNDGMNPGRALRHRLMSLLC